MESYLNLSLGDPLFCSDSGTTNSTLISRVGSEKEKRKKKKEKKEETTMEEKVKQKN